MIDDLFSGNWMIRGFGVTAPAVDVKALDRWGLVLLALMLGAVAIRRIA